MFFLPFLFLFLLEFWLLVARLSPEEGEGEGVKVLYAEGEGSKVVIKS
jgi:hypothetical protein